MDLTRHFFDHWGNRPAPDEPCNARRATSGRAPLPPPRALRTSRRAARFGERPAVLALRSFPRASRRDAPAGRARQPAPLSADALTDPPAPPGPARRLARLCAPPARVSATTTTSCGGRASNPPSAPTFSPVAEPSSHPRAPAALSATPATLIRARAPLDRALSRLRALAPARARDAQVALLELEVDDELELDPSRRRHDFSRRCRIRTTSNRGSSAPSLCARTTCRPATFF